MESVWKIGIDLGGTKTEAILLDNNGTEILKKRVPTPASQGYKAILDSTHELIVETSGHVPENLAWGVGIGIPGTIHPTEKIVQMANATCLNGMPFKKDIEKLLGRRVVIENDANCFVLAESIQGAACGYSLVFGVIMGTGCGGGICIDGRIRKGLHGIAGEWGHISVDPTGADCFCGNKGCVETKICGKGVENTFYTKFKKTLSMENIVAGYRKGDLECTEVFEHFLDEFGRCLGGLISILDPDAVVIGGGLSNIDELYDKGAVKVREHVCHHDLKTPILKNRLGDSAGVLGAAWLGATGDEN